MIKNNSDWEMVPGGVTAAKGFLASGAAAGIKYKEKKDIALIFSEVEARVAGMFTTNKVKAAPVLVTMERVSHGSARAVVANSGNANTCNGEQGMQDARAMGSEAARSLGIPEESVLVASTGAIGLPMPMERVLPGIAEAASALSKDGGGPAAEAIMTTDTESKEAAVSFSINGKKVTIGATAKGSGMIHPNMATMLCFITTDAAVELDCLKEALRYAVDRSFNMITVDRDTSTNDMVLVLANAQAANEEITVQSKDYFIFRDHLTRICSHLAQAMAKDGEGATKMIEAQVINAATEADARLAARAVAGSNLVKAAIFGEDANWGRILCAAGYSGAEFNPDTADVFLNGVKVAENGCSLAGCEEDAARALSENKVHILIDFKSGNFEATAWGCDLTYNYVRINAHYRT
ncbi:MAG: Arginine biosynthesis bifunctional protein ArgJ [Desulfofundulus kuznetsovii]|nr:MAG: Arginine biosynthesis bifunctional protein ArgJ [Desulfotomaculum sp. 46_80]KUK84916.1 MAG: Arginine biosynthesis bifunctional protein ArgJ [Desulfofundulus kuznetsovii]